jgi:hypothetical protein
MQKTEMTSLKSILKLSLFSFLSSCDPGSAIKYEIENKTTEPLTAEYEFVVIASGDESSGEITISPNASRINIEDRIPGYVTHYD